MKQILHSFESLVRRMDPVGEPEVAPEEMPQPAAETKTVTETGLLLGRKWRRYSDGTFEGETTRGMQAFRDLDHFRVSMEVSPVIRSERRTPDLEDEDDDEDEELGPAVVPPPIQSVSAADIVRKAEPQQRQVRPATMKSAQPVQASGREVRLARELVLAGGLGLILCTLWWFRSYVFEDLYAELARRGISEPAIRLTHRSVRNAVCLVVNTEPCVAVKHWGRLAGYVIYEPAFLWGSLIVLALGLLVGAGLRRRGAIPA